MENKPVAWAIKHKQDLIEFQTDKSDFEETVEFYKLEGWEYEIVPLYTAPRELSDEEINKLWTDSYDFNGRFCVYEFARAILKKASEK